MSQAIPPQHFHAVTKTFHWLTALLILTLIPLGFYANQLPFGTDAELAQKIWAFSLHKTLGVAAFLVALLRILWALITPRPGDLHPDRKLETFLAHLIHWVLYAALVIVPLSGWITHAAATGLAPIWWPFGQNLPLIPKSASLEHAAATVHWIAARLLILSLLLHIAGALKHHVIDRDATLRRMLPGRPSVPPVPAPHKKPTAALAALALWGLTIAVGATAAQAPKATETLAAVSSDWQVQDGTLGLTITQMGKPVAGSFSDWTAAITFDDTLTNGPLGETTVTIAIPSLTLGSVTKQAMGADFFDADTHATATFTADILRAGDNYEAQGTLQIKDQTIPVTLPFTLTIQGDTATMEGELTLDRRDFNIGGSVKDESSLAFAVAVNIALTATRAAE